MRAVVFLCCLFFLATNSYAQTVIHLHSGKTVEGQLVETTDDCVKIKVYDVDLTFWRDEIDHITFEDGQAVIQEEAVITPEQPTLSLPEETAIIEEVDTKAIVPVLGDITIDGNPTEWTDVPTFVLDKEGDVMTTFAGEDVWEFDVSRIKLATDENDLYVLFEFADSVDYYVKTNENRAKVIGTLYFDVDDDKSTGGEEFFSEKAGFESRLDIWSGVKKEDGGASVSGDAFLGGDFDLAELVYFMEVFTSKFNPETNSLNMSFQKKIRSDEKSDLIDYDERYIEFKVPLEDINMKNKKGGTIRALFVEKGSGLGEYEEETYSEASAMLEE